MIIKGRSPTEVSLIVIIKEVSEQGVPGLFTTITRILFYNNRKELELWKITDVLFRISSMTNSLGAFPRKITSHGIPQQEMNVGSLHNLTEMTVRHSNVGSHQLQVPELVHTSVQSVVSQTLRDKWDWLIGVFIDTQTFSVPISSYLTLSSDWVRSACYIR